VQRDGSTDYRVIEREGHVRVLRESPDQSTRHGLLSKIGEPLLGALTNGF
jgi:hypothetical protein